MSAYMGLLLATWRRKRSCVQLHSQDFFEARPLIEVRSLAISLSPSCAPFTVFGDTAGKEDFEGLSDVLSKKRPNRKLSQSVVINLKN